MADFDEVIERRASGCKAGLNAGPDFGPPGDGFVRLDFGCPRVVLESAIARMARALAEA